LPDGKIQLITKLDRNDIFGEMRLIDQLPRSATVRALEDSSISVMTQDTFNSLAKNPQGIYANLKGFGEKI
jgi:CRP-like cAMP-binding protein